MAHEEEATRADVQAILGALPAGESDPNRGPEGRAHVQRLDLVRPKAVRWLWRPRIALSSITLLVGVPGLGKSTLAAWIAARATRGLLDGDVREPMNVLYATAEDTLAEVLVPRLIAADADLGRVSAISMIRQGLDGSLELPTDSAALALAIDEYKVRLFILDPVMAHLGADTDSHKDQSIRLALAPLHHLAEAHSCAILVLGHTNKTDTDDLFRRVGGSIGLTGAARNVLLMTPDPEAEKEDDEARVLVHGKGNLGRKAPTQRLRVCESNAVAADDGNPISTAMIEFGESAPHIHVSDALRKPDTDEERSEIDEAMDYLAQALEGGPRSSTEIMREGKQLGHAERTLKRARSRLGVTAQKSNFGGGWTIQLSEGGHANGAPGLLRGAERRGQGGPSPLRRGEGPPWPSSFASGRVPANSATTVGPLREGDDFRCAQGCGRSVGRPGITCAQCAITEA